MKTRSWRVTREFLPGSFLAGIRFEDVWVNPPTVGWVCEKPVGGSPYKIVSVEAVR